MLQFLVQAPYITGFVMTQNVAVAATLLIRFVTLWFGVGIGLIALTFMERRLGRIEKITRLPTWMWTRAPGAKR